MSPGLYVICSVDILVSGSEELALFDRIPYSYIKPGTYRASELHRNNGNMYGNRNKNKIPARIVFH